MEALDVVRGERLLVLGGDGAEPDLKGADLVKLHCLGVLEMLLHDLEELDEHGIDVGTGHGGGMGDLLGELTGRHGAQTDGAAEPLSVSLTLQCYLLLSVKYCHNFEFLSC